MEKEKIDFGNKSALIGTIFKWSVILAIALIALFIFLCIRSDNAKNSEIVPTIATITSNENGEPIEKKYTITSEFLEKNLKNIGKLSTVEASYNGMITAEDGDFPVLTQKGYSMYYIGAVTAGIDVERISIEITENEVIVTVPNAEIQSLKVDPDSIIFANVKKALFNWTTIEEGIDGIRIAEKELMLQAHEDDILTKADEQVDNIIRTLLEDIVRNSEGEPELVIVRKETDEE